MELQGVGLSGHAFTVYKHLQLCPTQCKLAKNNSGAIGREFESLRARQFFPLCFAGLRPPTRFRQCRIWAQLGAKPVRLWPPVAVVLPAWAGYRCPASAVNQCVLVAFAAPSGSPR